MHDISYRKVGGEKRTAPQQKLASVPVTKAGTAQIIERALERATRVGDWFFGKVIPPKSYVVKTPSYRTANAPKSAVEHEKTPKKAPLHTRAASHALHVKEKAKTATGKAKAAVRTPLGKVTIMQTAALLGLFAYVTYAAPTQVSVADQGTAKNGVTIPTASPTVETLHQFLPTAQDYVQPQAFAEASATSGKLPLNAWAAPWNLEAIGAQATSYASLSAFWLTLNPDGSTFQTKADWSTWQTFKAAHSVPGQKLYLTVSGNPDNVISGIIDPTLRSQQISNLLQIVTDQGFDGVDIDYEGLGDANKDIYTSYVTDLATAFHRQNKAVTVTLEARIGNIVPMDWHALGLLADQVRVMVYDYHSSITDQPGPVAPLGWLKDVMDYANSTIGRGKLVIGLGNYGYDWTEPATTAQSWSGTGISFEQAMALSQEYSAPVVRQSGIDARGYDIGSIPSFTYKDDAGKQHQVWFEDSASLQAKINLISQYDTQGVIFWSVGLGDTQFWEQSPTGTTN